jgi:DegV family protein with EDD domain
MPPAETGPQVTQRMDPVALICDSTADLPLALASALGITVVRASFAFDEQRYLDGDLSSTEFYGRMRISQHLPRPFGAAERAFADAFTAGLAHAEQVTCLVMPFDVNPSFTTAAAAMLALKDTNPDAQIKILNPGVASVGLASLLIALRAADHAACSGPEVAALADELGPRCDALFVPGETEWLGRAGRLPMLEERLGAIDDSVPIVRVGTRITGVALAPGHEAALEAAARRCGARVGTGTPLIVTIAHADSPGQADAAASLVRRHWDVARLEITELSATIGSHLGPGAIGIGTAPAAAVREN